MTTFVFRCIYLVLVLTGLIISAGELRSALIIYRALVASNINGARQALASHFVRKALLLCIVQVFLTIPALLGFALIMPEVGNSMHVSVAILVALLSHVGAVACLTLMVIMSWYDRRLTMSMLSSEMATENEHIVREKAVLAALLRSQLDEILEAIRNPRKAS